MLSELLKEMTVDQFKNLGQGFICFTKELKTDENLDILEVDDEFEDIEIQGPHCLIDASGNLLTFSASEEKAKEWAEDHSYNIVSLH